MSVEPATASGFAACLLEGEPIDLVGAPNTAVIDAIAHGSWLGDVEYEYFGFDVAVSSDGVVAVLAAGLLLPYEAQREADASVRSFDDPPVGPTPHRAAATRIRWHESSYAGYAATAGLAFIESTPTGGTVLLAPSVGGLWGELYGYALPLPTGPAVSSDGRSHVFHRDSDRQLVEAISEGDIDGDGNPDLSLGIAVHLGGGGSVHAVHRGPVAPGEHLLTEDADFVFDLAPWHPDPSWSSVGRSRSAIPDVDGDGSDDILVGSIGYAPGGELSAFADLPPGCEPGGMVLWTEHEQPGTYTMGSQTAIVEGTCGSCIGGIHGAVGGVGPDPAVNYIAAIGETLSLDGVQERGALFLMDLRGVQGTVSVADVSPGIIVGATGDHLTDFVPLGDLNADGHGDLLVSSRYAGGSGSVFLFFGPVEGLVTTDTAAAIVRGGAFDGVFGSALAAHDFDGDGLVDVLVGSPKHSQSATDAGAVHYLRGRDLLLLADPDAELPPLPGGDSADSADTGAPTETDTGPAAAATGDTGGSASAQSKSGDEAPGCGCNGTALGGSRSASSWRIRRR